jgi:Bifunctional DNA primase/polymerase, N-terminal
MTRKRTKDLGVGYVDEHFGKRFIFPIAAGKKFPPCIKNNLEDASNDPKQIEEWERKWPGCNWGVAHRKSKLLVADVDTNKAKGKIGDATYFDLDLQYGWPETEKTTTPSGGFHMVYEGWADENHPEHIMALGENGIGKDIDSPNYTLIPGCTFDDGTSYVGNGVDAVRCPEWIYDTIKSSKTKSRITDAGEIVVELDQPENVATIIDYLKTDAVPSIEGQNGDANLLKAAYYLKDFGISQTLGVELLNEYFNPRCEPQWDLDDLAKKMAGAYTYANLSKVGGKTAEADFADDKPEPITPKGDQKIIAAEKRARERDIKDGIKKPPKYRRKRVIFSPVDLTQSLHSATMAIRADKVHDPVFRRGPLLVRLNQAVTERDLEIKKVKRKRGALMIATVVPDYMTLRLDQAGEFYVGKKPKAAKGKPGPKPKEKSNGDD